MKSTNIQIIEAYKRHLDLGLNVGSEGNISVKYKVDITPSGIDINKIGKKHISVTIQMVSKNTN